MRKLVAPALAALLACAVSAAPTSAASPPKFPTATPKKVKFLATFEGKRTVKWDMPRWAPPSDCFHTRYAYGDGEETWQVKSARPTKVLAIGSGKIPLIKIGSWSLTDNSPQIGIDASGIRTRRADLRSGWTPGSCGGTSDIDTPKPDDCGTRLPKHSVVPGFSGRKVFTEVISAPDNMAPGFDTCTIWIPKPLHGGGWDRFEGTLPKKVKDRHLFGKAKTLTFSFKDDWSDSGYWVANGGFISTSAHMEWKLTLKRVK